MAVSAILHHRFVSIHPFSDGNGRVARALSMWILYKRGFDSRHIFSVDDYFASNREMYYKKIQQARELDGDLTYWIEYTASAVETTLKDVKVRLNKLAVPAGTKIELTSRQEELLAVLKSKHRLSISELGSVMRLTRARLNQIIAPLIEKGIVKTAGRSRATRYSL